MLVFDSISLKELRTNHRTLIRVDRFYSSFERFLVCLFFTKVIYLSSRLSIGRHARTRHMFTSAIVKISTTIRWSCICPGQFWRNPIAWSLVKKTGISCTRKEYPALAVLNPKIRYNILLSILSSSTLEAMQNIVCIRLYLKVFLLI